MFSWILALLLALVVWSLATAYFWLVKRRRKEVKLGLNALAGMHWRDFSEIVKRAMREQRGLVDVHDEDEDHREPRSDFLMEDPQHKRWLLACKHGLAYRIGPAAVNELGTAARLAGAKGGILITEGQVQRDGRAAAEKQGVEVLDGQLLWPMLIPYLPGDMESAVKKAARREAVRRISIAALGSLTLGLLVGMSYLTTRVDKTPAAPAPTQASAPAAAAPAATAPAASPVTAAPASAPPTAAAATPAPAAQPPGPPAPGSILGTDGDPDAATLAQYRRELAQNVGKQTGVLSAFWQTSQTLAVNRSEEIDAVWPLICTEVKRYPALRTVRVQLNPRPGTEEPVRWRQCATS
ncbi:restriction endonuclease [Stenotrophomonas oahuensis]|uniref:Restriction endonuclease n=1 Tax=Stenotrophomonas oahuensis TaxID=3003271 RepID=A0ABY9YPB0_9GAMM|nr:restriction endonuclease [Stenotrophomonas sp. A5586]WNH52548.1 restriction endonuclease [Stenotrophomonas sp. A5586]